MIAEVIIVEGRADVSAVRQAVEAELLCTGGFALSAQTLAAIATARKRRGVIILTDPDVAGEQIRRRIERAVGPCLHARIPRAQCTRRGNVGIENASPAAIRLALSQARATQRSPAQGGHRFTISDLRDHALTGVAGAADRRAALGDALRIGRVDARQLLRRLNHYGITEVEFAAAVAQL